MPTDTSLSKDKLLELKKVDDRKRATEAARNQLEAFVINMKDVLSSGKWGRDYTFVMVAKSL